MIRRAVSGARGFLAALLVSATAGCMFVLDFDDESELGCPCLPDHVCLNSSNRCVKKGSTDLFKSCVLDVDNPDDLCPVTELGQAKCVAINGAGPRCLPPCIPSNYTTPDSGLHVAAQCPSATTCWPLESGEGVCSEGICDELANNCPAAQKCIAFNGAGVCFTPCPPFQLDACVGAALCHPIGESPETACILAGKVPPGEACTDTDPCVQVDSLMRPLVCDLPINQDGPRRCLPICRVGTGAECVTGESCQPTRTITGATLGVCI